VEDRFGRFPATAHLAETDQSGVGLNLDNSPNKTPPVNAIGMAQGRLEWNCDSRGANIFNLHGGSPAKQYQLLPVQQSCRL
jgi:hypothetical protein